MEEMLIITDGELGIIDILGEHKRSVINGLLKSFAKLTELAEEQMKA